jgi:hypothetical protein
MGLLTQPASHLKVAPKFRCYFFALVRRTLVIRCNALPLRLAAALL